MAGVSPHVHLAIGLCADAEMRNNMEGAVRLPGWSSALTADISPSSQGLSHRPDGLQVFINLRTTYYVICSINMANKGNPNTIPHHILELGCSVYCSHPAPTALMTHCCSASLLSCHVSNYVRLCSVYLKGPLFYQQVCV